jgi:hypothetical protein
MLVVEFSFSELHGRIEPAALLRQPQQTEAIVSNPGILTMRSVPAHAVYGFAVLPAGFFAQFARHHRVYLVAERSGGIIASTEPIPERVFEEFHAGTRRLRVSRMVAMSKSVSDVCTRYS